MGSQVRLAGGNGATISDTFNVISGDGTGNGQDSGIDPTTIITFTGPGAAAPGNVPIFNGLNNKIEDQGVEANLQGMLFASGISPIPDGTYPVSDSLGGSNTYISGVLITNNIAD
jgi:hypothetical protein